MERCTPNRVKLHKESVVAESSPRHHFRPAASVEHVDRFVECLPEFVTSEHERRGKESANAIRRAMTLLHLILLHRVETVAGFVGGVVNVDGDGG